MLCDESGITYEGSGIMTYERTTLYNSMNNQGHKSRSAPYATVLSRPDESGDHVLVSHASSSTAMDRTFPA